MTKTQARQFWWFAQGFLAATERLRFAALKRDHDGHTRKYHFNKGAHAAALLLEKDLRKRRNAPC